jgi:hypothetical protein
MRIHGFCLFVLLLATLAVPADTPLSRESDENLDKQLKALEKQIRVLQDQIDELRNKQAPLLAEQQARTARQGEIERRNHFAQVELRGKLRKSGSWQVVVNDRAWEIHITEKAKELLAGAENLIDKGVVITGSVLCSKTGEPYPRPGLVWTPYGLLPANPQLPVYVFAVMPESLQPAPMTPATAGDKTMQKRVKSAVQKRIDVLAGKSDDVLTKREYDELIGLREALKQFDSDAKPDPARLSITTDPALKATVKDWERQLDRSDKLTHYAKVQFRGKLLPEGTNVWKIQIGASNFNSNDWWLKLGDKNDLMTFARDHEGKEVVVTGTVTAEPRAHPAVNVESMKRPGN